MTCVKHVLGVAREVIEQKPEERLDKIVNTSMMHFEDEFNKYKNKIKKLRSTAREIFLIATGS